MFAGCCARVKSGAARSPNPMPPTKVRRCITLGYPIEEEGNQPTGLVIHGIDHGREVRHRMPAANRNVSGRQLVQLNETAVSRNSERFEVVDDRRVEAALRFRRSTRLAD